MTTRPVLGLSGVQWTDIGERVLWSVLYAAVGVALVSLDQLPATTAALLTGILALLKTYLAAKISASGSAATLPAAVAPVPPPLILENPPPAPAP